MHINTLADKVRQHLPGPLWECVRKISNAILGPAHFSIETGHLRSSLASRAMDRHGDPLPWFTYSAIQFLLMKNFQEKTVLEWGSGQSTLFWAKRAKSVFSLEADQKWFEKIKSSAPRNVSLHLVKFDVSDVDPLIAGQSFDVIVCDGMDRYACAAKSISHIAPDGVIIVDNSDGNQGPKPGYGFIELYRQNNFSRIDFYGFPPGNSVQQCTSLFFRETCFLLKGLENPWPPLTFWDYPSEIKASWQKGEAKADANR